MQKPYSWILFGLKFCPALILSVLIKFIVWGLLLLVLNLPPAIMGDVTINIAANNIPNILSQIIREYFLSIEYLPILVFVLSFLIFFVYAVAITISKKKPLAFVLFFFNIYIIIFCFLSHGQTNAI